MFPFSYLRCFFVLFLNSIFIPSAIPWVFNIKKKLDLCIKNIHRNSDQQTDNQKIKSIKWKISRKRNY